MGRAFVDARRATTLVRSIGGVATAITNGVNRVSRGISRTATDMPDAVGGVDGRAFCISYGGNGSSGSNLSVKGTGGAVGTLRCLVVPNNLCSMGLDIKRRCVSDIDFLNSIHFHSVISVSRCGMTSTVVGGRMVASTGCAVIAIQGSLGITCQVRKEKMMGFCGYLLGGSLDRNRCTKVNNPIKQMATTYVITPSIRFSVSKCRSSSCSIPLATVSKFNKGALASIK